MVRYISSSLRRRKINENFFLYRYHFYTIIALLPFLTSKTLLQFFFRIFIFESPTSNIFISISFWIIIVCKCYTTFNVLLLFFNSRWICAFSLCPRVSVFSKNLAVFTLINQLMQMLSSKDVLPNECSRNIQKVVEKLYLWVNSFLTEMQFSVCTLTFTGRIKFIGVFQEFSWSFQKTTILQNSSRWLLPYMASVASIFANFELIHESLWRWKFSLGWSAKVYLREFLYEVKKFLNEAKKS